MIGRPIGEKYSRIIVVASLFVLVATTVGILFSLMVEAPVNSTEHFLRLLESGSHQEIKDMLHPDYGSAKGDRDSGEAQDLESWRGNLKDWNARLTFITGSRASVDADLLFKNGEKRKVRFVLRNDGGGWLIYDCRPV